MKVLLVEPLGQMGGHCSAHSKCFVQALADVGEIGEAVRNYRHGLLFEAENPQGLRETVLHFLSLGEEEKREMKENLSRFARDHSWREVAQRHLELYQSLLAESGKS